METNAMIYEEIDWVEEEQEINEEEEYIRDKIYHSNLDGEGCGNRIMDRIETFYFDKKINEELIELEKRKLRLAKFKLASKNALFKIIA